MAINYYTATNSGTGTSVSVTKPTVANGDYIVGVVNIEHNTYGSAVSVSTGPGGDWIAASGNPYRYSTANWSWTTYFYHQIVSDASGLTFTATLDNSTGWAGALLVVSSDTYALLIHGYAAQVNSSSSTAIPYPSVATAPSNSISVCVVGHYASYMTHTASSGYTEKIDQGSFPNNAAQILEGVSGTVSPGDGTLSGAQRSNVFHAVVYEDTGGGSSSMLLQVNLAMSS